MHSVSETSQVLLSGWGGTPSSRCELVALGDTARAGAEDEVSSLIERVGPRGVLVRGLGRSYGDAAQNAGGLVLDGRSLSRRIDIDTAAATARLGAGASLEELMTRALPLGLFAPVTPGTRQVTVGGAIAADVHGKNHHRDGTFGQSVTRLVLIDGLGQRRELSPGQPEFAATVGGMGLTGIVVEADVRLARVANCAMSVDTDRLPDLASVMTRLVETDRTHKYTVAWIDTLASGSSLGRGVVTAGDHAPQGVEADQFRFEPRSVAAAPKAIPSGALNRLTVRAFNEAWYRKAPKRRRGELQSIGAFFHPLDGVRDWNRIYGRNGFLQYQFAVPDSSADFVSTVLARFSQAGIPCFLAVLKRFGPANDFHLSFPTAGWTLALDIPVGVPGLSALLRELDSELVAAGGRIYFAKDSRLDPALVSHMYPRLAQWRAVRETMDPDRKFTSDLSRRLRLVHD